LPVHYLSTRKNQHHGLAIAKGFQAETVPVETARLVASDLHLIGGLQFGSLEILMEARFKDQPYVFFDRAYFGGGPGSNKLRVVPNSYQKNWVDDVPGDRWDSLGIKLRPWKSSSDGYILFVPPSSAPLSVLFGLSGWEETMLRRLEKTGRKVLVSKKPDPRPLQERLRGACCVVTWTSNVAVESVLLGVPVFCADESAARPVAGGLDQIDVENLIRPSDEERLRWAKSLAYGQFSLEEIENGTARELIGMG
jgi:hypothetical protein